mmetsp:Transcript_14691/g.46099  ORF Transcript_14691/g.46099 Transcript_14691/m.46099 type:complete len:526 (-) Transcript_14691:133-1710(-)
MSRGRPANVPNSISTRIRSSIPAKGGRRSALGASGSSVNVSADFQESDHDDGGTDWTPSTVESERDPLVARPTADFGGARLAWLIFLALGVGVLLPWNTFLTAFDFFSNAFPHVPFEFVVSLAYNYPSIIVLAASIKLGPKFSFTSRIMVALFLDFIVLVSVPLIVGSPLLSVKSQLYLVLAGVTVTGIATSAQFGAILGLSSLFPSDFTTAVMAGNGIAGLLVAGLRALTKVAYSADVPGYRAAARWYFFLSAGVIAACIAFFLVLLKLPITKYYFEINDNHKEAARAASQRRAAGIANSSQNLAASMRAAADEPKRSLGPLTPPSTPSGLRSESAVADAEVEEPPPSSAMSVYRKMKGDAWCVFYVFFVTLSLFPGLITEIQPVSEHIFGTDGWFQICLISTFMLGDLIGRSLPQVWIGLTPNNYWIAVLARTAFYPLIAFCIRPHYFDQSDIIPILVVLTLSVSNGYLGTLAMMFGPQRVEENEKEVGGIIMSFFLNAGIFVAVHAAVGVLYVVTGVFNLFN